MSLLQKHPQWAAVCTIYQTLRAKGYQALLAGGCVRDALLAREPKDLDMATDAPPEVVESLFEKSVGVGKAFGVIRVLLEGADVEVATFRTDGEYKDGRHPEKVVFTTPEEDALRRDFTVNALFLDPGIEVVFDFVEGQKDLQAGVLRTVGLAEQRFQEDHLRILRAVRFSGQLGFTIEAQTFAAIQKMGEKVTEVSAERKLEEMTKLLATPQRELALKNLRDSGLMSILFPFRGDDISFVNLPTQHNWQRWSLFLLPVLGHARPAEVLHGSLQGLKFSNKDKKNIQACFEVLLHPEKLFAMSFGLRLLSYAEESTRWACQILSYTGSPQQKGIEELQQNWLHLDEQLPPPFLNGHDLAGQWAGREIGARLQQVYVLQLEGQLTSRDEALSFVRGPRDSE